jgi:hypothetical protein
MPLSYQSKFVKCPFYHKHDTNRIVCEGLEAGNTINLCYENPHHRAAYMKAVCYDILCCRDCPVYIMLVSKYEEV